MKLFKPAAVSLIPNRLFASPLVYWIELIFPGLMALSVDWSFSLLKFTRLMLNIEGWLLPMLSNRFWLAPNVILWTGLSPSSLKDCSFEELIILLLLDMGAYSKAMREEPGTNCSLAMAF